MKSNPPVPGHYLSFPPHQLGGDSRGLGEHAHDRKVNDVEGNFHRGTEKLQKEFNDEGNTTF